MHWAARTPGCYRTREPRTPHRQQYPALPRAIKSGKLDTCDFTTAREQNVSTKITIIGVGDDGLEGLTRAARAELDGAATILGPSDLLEQLGSGQVGIVLPSGLDEMAQVAQQDFAAPCVMLASGDPLFYGTARFLCEKLGKDRFEVFPHVSSMQLAFARVKESWDDAYLSNLANQTLPYVTERIRTATKAGLFTTDQYRPQDVASALLERGIDYYTAYVCENLGSPDERVTRGSLAEIAGMAFPSLNVMILVRLPDAPDRPASMQGRRIFGNPDECFLQSQPKRGLLTRSEVRSVALAEMDLGPNSVVWDIGAGSGSVAIEAAQIAPSGRVYAIEMDPEDYNLLVENAQTFGVANLTAILGKAPDAWIDLPQPDAVFVGGTGRSVTSLVNDIWKVLRAGGRLVVNVASLDNLTSIQQTLRNQGVNPSVLMINVSRSQEQLDTLRLESANPSFLIIANKQQVK